MRSAQSAIANRQRVCVRALFAGLVGAVFATQAGAQSSPDDAACQPPPSPNPVQSSDIRLAADAEPGEPMHVTLRFRSPNGRPIRNLIVYAYHANAAGHYVPASGASGCFRFHGRLHGWARPDTVGRVTLRSIRPGAYPRSTEPAHVHLVVQFPGARGMYLNDVMFDDDVRLTAKVRAQQHAPGGTGVVHAVRNANGVWMVSRDIVLQLPTR